MTPARLLLAGIIGLDMANHHPERVAKLAVTGANCRIDGYTVGFAISARLPGRERRAKAERHLGKARRPREADRTPLTNSVRGS